MLILLLLATVRLALQTSTFVWRFYDKDPKTGCLMGTGDCQLRGCQALNTIKLSQNLPFKVSQALSLAICFQYDQTDPICKGYKVPFYGGYPYARYRIHKNVLDTVGTQYHNHRLTRNGRGQILDPLDDRWVQGVEGKIHSWHNAATPVGGIQIYLESSPQQSRP